MFDPASSLVHLFTKKELELLVIEAQYLAVLGIYCSLCSSVMPRACRISVKGTFRRLVG